MSHGGGSYEVIDNAQRRERQRQAALERSRQLRGQLDKLAAQLSAHAEASSDGVIEGLARSEPKSDASQTTITFWNRSAEQLVGRLHSSLQEARASEWSADLEQQLAHIAESGERAVQVAQATRAQSNAKTGVPAESRRRLEQRITGQIAALLTHLDPGANEHERDVVSAAARAAAQSDPLLATTLITDLKATVQTIAHSAERRRRDAAMALELVVQLDGIQGPQGDPEVRDLKELLNRVVRGETPLVEADSSRVADVRARAIAAEDRAYVAKEMTKAFSNLGYEVYETFAEDLSTKGTAYAFVEGEPEHAAEISLDAGRFAFRLVHASETADSSKDAELELSLCKAVGTINGRTRSEGVSVQVESHRRAGADPVPFVPQAARRRGHTKGSVSQLRERRTR